MSSPQPINAPLISSSKENRRQRYGFKQNNNRNIRSQSSSDRSNIAVANNNIPATDVTMFGFVESEQYPPNRVHHPIDRDLIDPDVLKVINRLVRFKHKAYLVGGCVRDLLLGVQPKDFDVVTSALPREVRRIFSNSKIIGRRFRLVHVFFANGKVIEVATFRRSPEVEEHDLDIPASQLDDTCDFNNCQVVEVVGTMGTGGDGNEGEEDADFACDDDNDDNDDNGLIDVDVDVDDDLPWAPPHNNSENDYLITDDNVFGTPAEDAFRRDFTINALFYDVNTKEIVDYVGGLADLDKRTIRAIGDPFVRLQEDPVRVLRAIRFAARLGLEIDPELKESIQLYAGELRRSASARVLEEIYKLMRPGCASSTMEMLLRYGVMGVLLPEVTDWIARNPDENVRKFLAFMAGLDKEIRTSDGAAPLNNASLLAALLFYPIQEILKWEKPVKSSNNTNVNDITTSPRTCPDNGSNINTYNEAVMAVSQFTCMIGQRMRVPRRDQDRIKNIMLVQRRIAAALGGGFRNSRVQSMVRRPCFRDALMLFQLDLQTDSCQGCAPTVTQELMEWLWALVRKVEQENPQRGSSENKAKGRGRDRGRGRGGARSHTDTKTQSRTRNRSKNRSSVGRSRSGRLD